MGGCYRGMRSRTNSNWPMFACRLARPDARCSVRSPGRQATTLLVALLAAIPPTAGRRGVICRSCCQLVPAAFLPSRGGVQSPETRALELAPEFLRSGWTEPRERPGARTAGVAAPPVNGTSCRYPAGTKRLPSEVPHGAHLEKRDSSCDSSRLPAKKRIRALPASRTWLAL